MTLYPHLVQKHSENLMCAKQMGCMTDGGLNRMCREHAWAACRVGRNRRHFSAPHIACRHLCRIATFCRLRGCSAKGPNESSQQYYWWRYHEALSVLPGAPELSSDWIRTLSGSSACEQSQYGGKLRCSLQSWKWLHVHCRASITMHGAHVYALPIHIQNFPVITPYSACLIPWLCGQSICVMHCLGCSDCAPSFLM